MDEYISKQDAIDDLHTQLMYRMGSDDMKRRLDDWVKTLPSVDVVPVVHGRWIDDGTEFGCQCSECGKSLDDYVAPTEYASLNEIPNFCPKCGAKMDREE